jgi:hypothetical protein
MRGLYLVVPDIEACRPELTGRGVAWLSARSGTRRPMVAGVAASFRAWTRTGPTMPVSPIFVILTVMRGCYRNVDTAELKADAMRQAGIERPRTASMHEVRDIAVAISDTKF